jgi:hypothetical protein
MRSTSLGKQRANRPSHRNGAVRRFLAALAASVIVGFGVAAPIAAAAAPSAPRHDGGGDTRHAGPADHPRDQLEHQRERREHGQQSQADGQPPGVQIPPTTVPLPGVTSSAAESLPTAVVPTVLGALPGGGTGRAAVTAPGSRARPASVTAAAGAGGGVVGAAPPQQAPTPPAAAPQTVPRSPVARALRTARSYGALLALAGAVLAFLLIQGRVDRRDPRIVSAPAEDRLSFRDFE